MNTSDQDLSARQAGTESKKKVYRDYQKIIRQVVIWGILSILIIWQLPNLLRAPGKIREAKQEARESGEQHSNARQTPQAQVPWQKLTTSHFTVFLMPGQSSTVLNYPLNHNWRRVIGGGNRPEAKFVIVINETKSHRFNGGDKIPDFGKYYQIRYVNLSEFPLYFEAIGTPFNP